MFSLRYLVVVFYRGDWKCGEVVEEFSNIKSQLASNGADVVCVSSDSTQTHSAWIKADKWINLSVSARSSSLYLQEQGRLGGQSGYSTVERSHWRIGQLLRSLSSRGETLLRKIAVCISLQIKLMNIFSLICLFQLCRDFLSSISSGMPINFWRMTIRLLVSLEKPVMGHETSHWSRSTSQPRFFFILSASLPTAILRWFCHHWRCWPDQAGDDHHPGQQGGGHQRLRHGPCLQEAQGQFHFSQNFFLKVELQSKNFE